MTDATESDDGCRPTDHFEPAARSSKRARTQLSETRRGKWSAPEEAFAARLIRNFESGLLTLENGSTLRAFLSKKLNCSAMRISKKFAGEKCLGKQIYAKRDVDAKTRRDEDVVLATLEADFLASVRGASSSAAANSNNNSSSAGLVPLFSSRCAAAASSSAVSMSSSSSEGSSSAASLGGAPPAAAKHRSSNKHATRTATRATNASSSRLKRNYSQASSAGSPLDAMMMHHHFRGGGLIPKTASYDVATLATALLVSDDDYEPSELFADEDMSGLDDSGHHHHDDVDGAHVVTQPPSSDEDEPSFVVPRSCANHHNPMTNQPLGGGGGSGAHHHHLLLLHPLASDADSKEALELHAAHLRANSKKFDELPRADLIQSPPSALMLQLAPSMSKSRVSMQSNNNNNNNNAPPPAPSSLGRFACAIARGTSSSSLNKLVLNDVFADEAHAFNDEDMFHTHPSFFDDFGDDNTMPHHHHHHAAYGSATRAATDAF